MHSHVLCSIVSHMQPPYRPILHDRRSESPGQACCSTDAAVACSAAKHWLVVPLMQHTQTAAGIGFWSVGILGTRGCVAQKWQPGGCGPTWDICLDQHNGVPAIRCSMLVHHNKCSYVVGSGRAVLGIAWCLPPLLRCMAGLQQVVTTQRCKARRVISPGDQAYFCAESRAINQCGAYTCSSLKNHLCLYSGAHASSRLL